MVALCISRKLRDRSEQDFDRRGETCTVADAANGINQYTSITHNETPFIPTFDADGNQTLVQSSTGIWTVVYNAENRPISFTKIEGEQTSIIECGYDYMGRRSTKKVTVNGALTLHQRYIYRGYLQIACVDLLRGGHPALWYTLWDPSEPIATRPLAIQKNGTWYTYGHDLTKNVTELYNADGTIATTYRKKGSRHDKCNISELTFSSGYSKRKPCHDNRASNFLEHPITSWREEIAESTSSKMTPSRYCS